jgi:predicted DNA-binding ribbon-helix-helix protein
MKSRVVKHSIVIDGHRTSISLEDTFWKALREIARGRNVRLSELVASINAERKHDNLSSAIRLFILDFYSMRRGEETTAGKASQVETGS